MRAQQYIDPEEYHALAQLQGMPVKDVIFNTFTYEDCVEVCDAARVVSARSVALTCGLAAQGCEPVVTNLKPNGRRIAVTDANKAEYALLKAQHILYRAAEAQLERVCDGFYSIVQREWIEEAVRYACCTGSISEHAFCR